MNINWRDLVLQILLAVAVALVLLFASTTTSRLHDGERKMHGGAKHEPQASNPAETFVEVVLESSPLSQLSAGFTGIAPSMHLIRLSVSRPLSNVDPIEHPSRRRYGRIDFSFAFLVFLPIALIPMYYFIYKRCVSRGDAEKLASGRTKLLDFCIERILLPLLGIAGFVSLVTLACLYAAGLRLASNEVLGLIAVWAVTVSFYLLAWILLFALFLLRSASFSSAIIQYAATFLLIVFIVPQFVQTVILAIERPHGRLPLVVERRRILQNTRLGDQAAVDRFMQRKGYSPLDWTEPMTEPVSQALVNLRIEEAIAPRLVEFESSVDRLDSLALTSSWLSPFLVAQYAVDDIAGTGLSRYSDFRKAAIEYHEKWQKYTFDFVARRQFLDYDALRNAPKFQYYNSDTGSILLSVLPRSGYLIGLCAALAFGISRQLRQLLPQSKKTGRNTGLSFT